MQLFYGPNSYQSNNGCWTIPEYDALYRKSIKMPAGPERDRLYQEMTRILEGYSTHRLTVSRYRNQLVQPRIEGYRKHPILPSAWQYLDVATSSN
jgi:ABC-type transport system substrate-binding protein